LTAAQKSAFPTAAGLVGSAGVASDPALCVSNSTEDVEREALSSIALHTLHSSLPDMMLYKGAT
jgi:hypothetical protein